MKTTIAKLINSDKALSTLLEQKLPLGISIQLGKVVTELEPVYKKANEARLEILKRYGEDKGDSQYQIKPENIATFEADMRETFDSEIELTVPGIDPAKMPDAMLTAKDAMILDWLWLA